MSRHLGEHWLMRKVALLIAAASLLGSCTTNPVPDDYHGPVARVTDSVTPLSGSSADFFYLSKIDGRTIDESLSATGRANYGRGMLMDPVVIARPVPARASSFTIVGRRRYAAPILELVNPIYRVTGDVDFIPMPDRTYVIKGILGEKYSGVWIEDSATGETVGRKVEVDGSAKLSIFEK
jgi:hypothetical protein